MAMGTGASDNSLRGPRDRNRPKSRLRRTRKARAQRVELEGLETRTLLATIPAATYASAIGAVAGSPGAAGQLANNISSAFGNVGGTNASQSNAVVAVDPLDPTKLVPEELVPVKLIGKMTLNRNPDNFFAETEQVAFHPGHVVPGVEGGGGGAAPIVANWL